MSELELENQPQGSDEGGDVLSDLDTYIESSETREPEAEEERPEPAAEESEEEQDGEVENDKTTDEDEDEPEAEEAEPEEEQADALDEVLGRLTLKERDQYAKRYPNAWKRANSPDATDDDRQILIDKINTDLEYRQLQESIEPEEEPTPEESDDEEAQTSQSVVDPAEQRKQYSAYIESIVTQRVDPQAAEILGRNLLQAFMPDVDLAKSDDPEVKRLVANAGKVGMTLAQGAVDLQASTLSALMPSVVEQIFPGFSDMYARSLYSMTWDSVRAFKDANGASPYANLPTYGSQEYKAMMKKVASQIDGFDRWEYRDKSGKPLPEAKQAELKLRYMAKLATSQNAKTVPPKQVVQALETGKKIARQTEQKRKAGRALGAGQSTRQALGSKSRDYILDDLDAEIQKQGGGMRGVRK